MSSIEWTDRTWNPVRGCSRVSEGCRHCYAERMAARYSGPGLPFEGFARRGVVAMSTTADAGKKYTRWTGRVELIPEKLDEPLHWRKPARVFVNSMSDLFHEALPRIVPECPRCHARDALMVCCWRCASEGSPEQFNARIVPAPPPAEPA